MEQVSPPLLAALDRLAYLGAGCDGADGTVT